jgi:cobalt-zinc-cadmium efflux system protein
LESSHNHHDHYSENKQKLVIILVLTGLFMVAELLGGLYTNSLALLADAGHMLSDVAALTLSYFAILFSTRRATSKKTYGYFRTEILAAFINGVALVGIALFIIYEAYTRIQSPPEVKAPLMIIIAVGGLLVNLTGAFLLHNESKENLNVRGAFLHIIGDLLGSVGAIIAGILIFYWNFRLADPIISIVIALLVLYSSINLINEAVHILMEGVPLHINVDEIREAILEIPDIKDVHDLHVWSIASNKVALSVHVVTDFIDNKKVLCAINHMLEKKFNILHSTVQIEPEDFPKSGCPLDLR